MSDRVERAISELLKLWHRQEWVNEDEGKLFAAAMREFQSALVESGYKPRFSCEECFPERFNEDRHLEVIV